MDILSELGLGANSFSNLYIDPKLLIDSRPYLVYLRKSRKDASLGDLTDEEILAKHKATLLELCRTLKIPMPEENIRYEIGSGDTIQDRPVFQQVLKELENNMWAGIIIVEIERLGRGDSMDQGRILQAIKYSKSRVITPYKMYYPYISTEDEEDLECDLNKSRVEYRRIKRRLQNGRIQAVKDGKYPFGNPPLGFRLKKLKDAVGYILEEVPEESIIVKTIFHLFVHERKGVNVIENEIYAMGYRSRRGKRITADRIRCMLQTLTYIGYVTWGHYYYERILVDGKLIKVRKISSDFIVVKALFDGFIDPEDFVMADRLLKGNKMIPAPADKKPKNPLAGVLKCKCGASMQRKIGKGLKGGQVRCTNPLCNVPGSYLDTIEEKLISMLEDYYKNLTLEASQTEIDANLDRNISATTSQIQQLEKNLNKVKKQYVNACEFFEQNLYDATTFQTRTQSLRLEQSQIEKNLKEYNSKLVELNKRKNQKQVLLPKVEHVIKLYSETSDISQKNQLLKSIIDKIVYDKEKAGTCGHEGEFSLYVFPRISA